LSHFGEEKRVVSGALGAARATSRRWQQGFVLRVKRRVGDVQMDFALNPLAEFPHGDGFGFVILGDGRDRAVLRETFLQRTLLVARLLCSRLHKKRYVVLVKMRLRIWNLLCLAHSPSLRAT
jgi:hypothetical protein